MSGDWPTVALSDIAQLSMGETLLSKNLTGDGIPVFSANTDEGPWGYTSNNRRRLRRGDIVIGARGSIGFPRRPDFDAFTCTQTTIAIQPDRDAVDNEYLHHALCATDILGIASQQAVPMLTIGSLSPLKIVLPPFDEQRRIAEVLRSVDEAIAAASEVVGQTNANLEAATTALVGLAASSSDWRHGRCDSFFVLQRGFDITESQASPGPYRVISSSGPTYSHAASAVEGPAVITGRKGRLGTVFYSDEACWPHDTTLWVKDFKGNHPRFVYWMLREMDLKAYDAATSVPTLNRNNVHALEIAFPPLAQQIDISVALDAMLSAIENGEEHLAALQRLKCSVGHDLLSGRVRVTA